MVKVGDKMRFTPSAFCGFKDQIIKGAEVEVTGTVIEVNEEHGWYRVEYAYAGGRYTDHETFKL